MQRTYHSLKLLFWLIEFTPNISVADTINNGY